MQRAWLLLFIVMRLCATLLSGCPMTITPVTGADENRNELGKYGGGGGGGSGGSM